VKAWLSETPWELLVLANQQLCEKAGCMHKISTASGKKAEEFWGANHQKKMSLQDMVLLCKRVHFQEPFVNMNGNTLAAVALEASEPHIPKTCSKTELEEAICTIIAGTVQGREELLLKAESETLDPPKKDGPELE